MAHFRNDRASPDSCRGLEDQGIAKSPFFRRWRIGRSGVGLACVLALSACLYLQNLGSWHIATWDEVVHVNVVRNLAENCCVPRLHRSDNLGTDYRDWTNNTVWLHKPLLPFYISAASYALFGHSLWALRLPGAVFSLLTGLMVFLIGRRFFEERTGVIAAAIYCLNPYTNELVHGRELSGFPDLEMVFFLVIALYLLLDWAESRSFAKAIGIGAAVGVAYLCKGALALAPLAVMFVLVLLPFEMEEFKNLIQSVAVSVAIVLPMKLFWGRRFPERMRYENHQQLLHLTQSIEGAGGPWHLYATSYLPRMVGPAAILFAYGSIVWGLAHFRSNRAVGVLSVWSLVYIVTLSLGVSKVENFIFAVLPALALLMPMMTEKLIENGRFRTVLALCIAWITSSVVDTAASGFRHPLRLNFAVLAGSFLLALIFVAKIHADLKAGKIAAITTAVLFLMSYAAMDWKHNQTRDDPGEASIRAAGLGLGRIVDNRALVLAHTDSHELADLYLMFWSGADVLDACRTPAPETSLNLIRNRSDLYLLTEGSLPEEPVGELPAGKLYSLKQLPYEVWRPEIEQGCHQIDPWLTQQPQKQ